MKESINEKIARNIRSLRELKGYTQEYVATELGIEQPNYSLIEKGKKPITFELAQKIAAILETSLETIQKFDSEAFFNNCKDKGHGQHNTNHFHSSKEIEELKSEMQELRAILIGIREKKK